VRYAYRQFEVNNKLMQIYITNNEGAPTTR
jgi:hypothetical protein